MFSFSSLLANYAFRTQVFYTGTFCGQTQFTENEGVGHLHWVRKGRLRMEHDHGADLEIDIPTLVIYPRPYRHRLKVLSPDVDLVCARLSFRNPSRNPLAKALPDVLALPLQELESLHPTLALLIEEASQEEDGRQEVMDRLCEVLFIQVIRHACKKGLVRQNILAGWADKRIAPVLSAIHAAPAKPWRVEDLAELACLSRSKFAQHFHEVIGMPPMEYLNQYRMALAESILRNTRSVKEAAFMVGYASQSAFSKAFTTYAGMPPTAWLKLSEKKDTLSGLEYLSPPGG